MALFSGSSQSAEQHSAYRAIRDSLRRCQQQPSDFGPLLRSPGGLLLLEVPAGHAEAIAALFAQDDELDGVGNSTNSESPRWLVLQEIVKDSRGTQRCLVFVAT